MRISEIINEGREAPLYHFTYIKNIDDILKSNTLGLRDKLSKKDLPVSLSRSKNHIFSTNALSCCLILDQKKLSYNYKLKPLFGDIEGDHHTYKEFEERIPKNIKPLNKYLLKIVLDYDVVYDFNHEFFYYIKYIDEWCTNYNIPLLVAQTSFDDNNNWDKYLQSFEDALKDVYESKYITGHLIPEEEEFYKMKLSDIELNESAEDFQILDSYSPKRLDISFKSKKEILAFLKNDFHDVLSELAIVLESWNNLAKEFKYENKYSQSALLKLSSFVKTLSTFKLKEGLADKNVVKIYNKIKNATLYFGDVVAEMKAVEPNLVTVKTLTDIYKDLEKLLGEIKSITNYEDKKVTSKELGYK